MKTILASAAVALMAVTGMAQAEDGPFQGQIDARKGLMLYRAMQVGVLGGMAKGEVPYDAAAAQKAADNLLAAVTLDASMLWPKGSDNAANPSSTALAAMWDEGSDIGAKATAMVDAATAMQAAAGTGLDGMKAALGPVGAACGGCHKAFRVSN